MNSPPPSDQDLVKKAAGGERDALNELAKRLSSCILLTAREADGRLIDAHDIEQETWKVVLRRLGDYNPDIASVRTWVCGIANRLTLAAAGIADRAHRLTIGQAAEDEVDLLAQIPAFHGSAGNPSRQERREETKRIVRDAIDLLKPEDRQLIRRRFLDELPLRQVAEELSIRPNCAAARCARALEELCELIGDRSDLL